ncbi:MAG: hypothetical protein V3T72_02055 [Thermoanaerobaculia bacterium]
MSLLTYKVLHILGISLALVALGGAAQRALDGDSGGSRKLAGITHGVGLLIILVSGFGLLAKLGIGFPPWVWLKLVIWLVIAALLVLIRKMPQHATLFWFALPVLTGIAAYLALYKPF